MKKLKTIWIILILCSLKAFPDCHPDYFRITDVNFLKFIKKNYPQIIDNDGDGIHPNMASSIYGPLDISNYNLSNVNGLQFFTNVDKIDLHNNSLSTIPDLSGMTSLQSLNVSFNKITSLPPLSSNINLIELFLQNNKLTSLPDLSKNTMLTQLVVNNNLLPSLPELSKLGALTNLIADNNLLGSLPDLSKCTNLQNLCTSVNKITAPPNIDSLPNLKSLNLSHNLLTTFPNLTNNKLLEYVYLNNNQISYIYNLPILNNLIKMTLHNNLFTFSSLIKILPYPNHKSRFEIAPQTNSYTVKTINKRVTDTLDIYTNIDSYVPNVYYLWKKNYAYYYKCEYDHLQIPNLVFADSGTYYCDIKHDSLPELSFRSDSYSIKIKNCVDLNSIGFTISSVDCENSGKLELSSNEGYTNNKYILSNNSYEHSDTSNTGKFSGLLDGNYQLQVLTPKGCLLNYPKEINIPKEDCNYPLITPNDDNDHDNYFFEQTGIVNIYDKHGYLVNTLSIPGAWDASSKNNKVRAGVYIADINKGEKIIKISVVY